MTEKRRVALVWESLGPSHNDRLAALVAAGFEVHGIALFAQSHDYDWEDEQARGWHRHVLAENRGSIKPAALTRRLTKTLRAIDPAGVFLCHYEMPAITLTASWLRARRIRAFTMGDSKWDDRPRRALGSFAKRLVLLPYRGAIAAGPRSADYFHRLGVPQNRITGGYDTLDIARLREIAGQAMPAERTRDANAPFLIVARLIREKNLGAAIRAFATYRVGGGSRRLRIAGDGPLREDLQATAKEQGVSDAIDWLGNVPNAVAMAEMAKAHALLLPSVQETYGLVVVEAFAAGLPVIVSLRAGVTDELVRDGVNGIVINPPDENELAAAMQRLDTDPALHNAMASAAWDSAMRADVQHFAEAVGTLLDGRPPNGPDAI